MRDIAIIGGGLSGLALAHGLHTRNRDFVLYEARERLGGRILTLDCAETGIAMDLGPAWVWPATQPNLARLCADHALELVTQKDDGKVLVLAETDKPARQLADESIHPGTERIKGGTGRLVDVLAADVPEACVQLGHELTALIDRGNCIELTFKTAHGETTVHARQVILAMPPRLIEEHILVRPELPNGVTAALRATPTWMAGTAKSMMTYGQRPDLAERAGSGNAFVTHEQATLAEIYDCSTEKGLALGGFLALDAGQRRAFREGLPLLIANQMAQVFGQEFDDGHLTLQDWANEPFTCSSQDLREPLAREPSHRGDPRLALPLWDGRLLLAGSETAASHAGYLEGALLAAQRVLKTIDNGEGDASQARVC